MITPDAVNRRHFLLTSLAAACAHPVRPAHAQSSGAPQKIGYLSRGTRRERTHEAFRQGLRELGCDEGNGSQGHLDHPVVFMGIPDPVGFGFVKSIARPGGNMTGFMYGGVEPNPKRLELLKEALPQATRFAALATSAHVLYSRMVDVGESNPPALDPAFEQISRTRVHGVLILQVCARSGRPVSARHARRRQDPEGREARRPSGRAADEVRAADQPQDRERARPHASAVAAAQG